ncbi:MAG: carboxypeptidase-like regulatory domain-containing protein, partial [Flavobacteriales bacterium]|nr:carboxypeptidase-like regulatory domain-containing protein [Flavobacteriales bacterium]
MKRLFSITIVFGLLLLGNHALAQTGKVKGFVYDSENGEPILFTNVILEGSTLGAATDVNGYYIITKVPVGDHTLKVTYLGYDTLSVPIKVTKDRITAKNLYLKKSSVKLDMVEVSAERQEA